MSIKDQQQKPSIHIYYNKNLIPIEKFKEIMWGIEEEGIPYSIHAKEARKAQALAYEACEESVLGVGIGIDGEDIVLHYIKLKKDEPLYQISTSADRLLMRILGGNGARLVKSIAFKTLEDYEVEKEIDVREKSLEEEVRIIVERVIARMKLG
ncbi:glycerol dehydratase reactivase beta/small subunit family protein [Marinisporobacter balticus]|uniref:Dehydratase medium subunit n=1 Tax=Marinisporobacter balticus TaxID=2018667 RepID=A0A4R2KXZ7_9FIRM|nr:glycerol dehydratase reactivase beta/small subunit family protein [Marinisporobacter balticus]TCO77962.1 dehydratase medium subunit [Marinisporobacter balticus]